MVLLLPAAAGRPRRASRTRHGCGSAATWLRPGATQRPAPCRAERPAAPIRTGSGVVWRAGTAHILDDDDPRERQRLIGQGDLARRLCVSASALMDTDPLTVRVDLDPADGRQDQKGGTQ
jgi:hypothetical protein